MFLENVKNRRSVRTFDGKGLSDEVLEDLKEYAKNIVNPPINLGAAPVFTDNKTGASSISSSPGTLLFGVESISGELLSL